MHRTYSYLSLYVLRISKTPPCFCIPCLSNGLTSTKNPLPFGGYPLTLTEWLLRTRPLRAHRSCLNSERPVHYSAPLSYQVICAWLSRIYEASQSSRRAFTFSTLNLPSNLNLSLRKHPNYESSLQPCHSHRQKTRAAKSRRKSASASVVNGKSPPSCLQQRLKTVLLLLTPATVPTYSTLPKTRSTTNWNSPAAHAHSAKPPTLRAFSATSLSVPSARRSASHRTSQTIQRSVLYLTFAHFAAVRYSARSAEKSRIAAFGLKSTMRTCWMSLDWKRRR